MFGLRQIGGARLESRAEQGLHWRVSKSANDGADAGNRFHSSSSNLRAQVAAEQSSSAPNAVGTAEWPAGSRPGYLFLLLPSAAALIASWRPQRLNGWRDEWKLEAARPGLARAARLRPGESIFGLAD